MVEVGDGGRGHPVWCVVDHAQVGAPAAHQGRGVEVAVQAWVAGDARSPGGTSSVRELVAVPHGSDDGQLWLYVGDGEDQHLDLTAESWRRVVAAVEGALVAGE